MTRLATLLAELEQTWLDMGMPHTNWLGPGLSPHETRDVLRNAGLTTPDEIIEWFAWHNGTSSETAGLRPYLGPSTWEPLSLAGAFAQRQDAVEMVEEIDEPTTWWEAGWLPIGRFGGGNPLLLVDLADADSDQAAVINFAWDDDPHRYASSIAEAVDAWISVLRTHARWVPAERSASAIAHWEVEFDKVPLPQRRLL